MHQEFRFEIRKCMRHLEVFGVAQNTSNTSVGVLHVIDGIIVGALLEHINVKHHRGIYRITDQGIAGSINTDLLNQIFERNDCSSTFRKFYLFTALHNLNHLANEHMDVVVRIISCTSRYRFQTIDITMMISTKHVYADVEAAFTFINVISSIGCEVCEFASALD